LAINQKYLVPASSGYILCCNNIAAVHDRLGDTAQSVVYYERARIALHSKAVPRDERGSESRRRRGELLRHVETKLDEARAARQDAARSAAAPPPTAAPLPGETTPRTPVASVFYSLSSAPGATPDTDTASTPDTPGARAAGIDTPTTGDATPDDATPAESAAAAVQLARARQEAVAAVGAAVAAQWVGGDTPTPTTSGRVAADREGVVGDVSGLVEAMAAVSTAGAAAALVGSAQEALAALEEQGQEIPEGEDEFGWRAGQEEEDGNGPLDARVVGAIERINESRDAMNAKQLLLEEAR